MYIYLELHYKFILTILQFSLRGNIFLSLFIMSPMIIVLCIFSYSYFVQMLLLIYLIGLSLVSTMFQNQLLLNKVHLLKNIQHITIMSFVEELIPVNQTKSYTFLKNYIAKLLVRELKSNVICFLNDHFTSVYIVGSFQKSSMN